MGPQLQRRRLGDDARLLPSFRPRSFESLEPVARFCGHGVRRRVAGLAEQRPATNDESGRRQQAVSLARLRDMASGEQWQAWVRSVEAELILEGLLKPGRLDHRQRITRATSILFALALLVTVIAVVFYGAFGHWPFYLVVALFFQALLWRSVAGGPLVLSDEGARRAAEWERFYHYLSQVSWGNAWPVSNDDCAEYLPYAAAYGLATSWIGSFGRRGYWMTPVYFHPFDPDPTEVAGSFLAMVTQAGRIMWQGSGRRQWGSVGSTGLYGLPMFYPEHAPPYGWRASEPDN